MQHLREADFSFNDIETVPANLNELTIKNLSLLGNPVTDFEALAKIQVTTNFKVCLILMVWFFVLVCSIFKTINTTRNFAWTLSWKLYGCKKQTSSQKTWNYSYSFRYCRS